MARIPDEINICLRCTYGEQFGPSRHPDEEVPRTWCMCRCPNIGGGNKGHRQRCAHYEPNEEARNGEN